MKAEAPRNPTRYTQGVSNAIVNPTPLTPTPALEHVKQYAVNSVHPYETFHLTPQNGSGSCSKRDPWQSPSLSWWCC